MTHEQKQKTFKLFVGSNNDTKKLESEKIKNITHKHFIAFTILKGVGCYKDIKEKTAIIEIITEHEKKVFQLANELKSKLKQESILIQELKVKNTFY